MINSTLLKKEIKSNYKILLIFMGVLALYASMIISMFDPKLGDSLKIMMQSMPELFSAFGMGSPGSTLIEFLVNYLYGFLLTIFPMVFIILLANRLVVRYVDRGSMVYLLSSPNTRGKIIRTQILTLLLSALCLIVFLTGLCILCSQAMFPGELDVPALLKANLGLYGLHVFLSGLCFFCSCLFSDSRLATGTSAGLCIAFVLVQMLSQVGDKYEFLKYATPMTLYRPKELITGDGNALLCIGILYAAGIALIFFGSAIFCKKDLSI